MRSKLKGLFFILRLDRFIPSYIFNFIAHITELSKWISIHKSRCDNDFYVSKIRYSNREALYEKIISQYELDTDIAFLEFGVSKGVSLSWWVNRIKDSRARFMGFDTFCGLPEDWGKFKKGDMDNEGFPPILRDDRCTFYKGMFQDTLIPFLDTHLIGSRKVIHMDADLYSSTLFVLTTITPYIREGDIIFFDEFAVPMHEFKAFTEWTKSFYIGYEVIGAVNNFSQIAIMIK